jgi:hypothetical protein
MSNQELTRFATPSRSQAPGNESMPRRVNHGGSPWSIPARYPATRQPQDGALRRPARVSVLTSPLDCEPEDAGLTGGTRSLTRRLMGLNVTLTARRSVVAVLLPKPVTQVA